MKTTQLSTVRAGSRAHSLLNPAQLKCASPCDPGSVYVLDTYIAKSQNVSCCLYLAPRPIPTAYNNQSEKLDLFSSAVLRYLGLKMDGYSQTYTAHGPPLHPAPPRNPRVPHDGRLHIKASEEGSREKLAQLVRLP